MAGLHPFFEGLAPTLHVAHRGGAALAPENTLPAFEQAVRVWRTEMLELDVHGTRDGQVVVFHDPTLDRCTDAMGPLAERTLAELADVDAGHRFTADGGRTFPFRGQGIGIPTLAEVLRTFPRVRLNVDLKPTDLGLVDLFLDVVRAEDAAARICAGSEHDAVALRLAEADPAGCRFAPTGAVLAWVSAVKQGRPPPVDPRWHVLDLPFEWGGTRVVDPPLIEAARAAGLWVNTWTVDDPAAMRMLVAWEVGGIMTDRPDHLRAVLDGEAP